MKEDDDDEEEEITSSGDDDIVTINNNNSNSNIIDVPGTENKHRKKCAKTNDGLAIKYNKLIFNFADIMKFKCFRKYCVFFDLFSKRHFINHDYRIDLLKVLNCYDFTPYSYKTCTCNCNITCMGFILCFNDEFMHRKKYSNHKEDKSEYMLKLYEKHSMLNKDNNFFDNKINTEFIQRINQFETLNPITILDKKTFRLFTKNMYKTAHVLASITATRTTDLKIECCRKCKNIQTTKFKIFNVVRFSNFVDMSKIHDVVLKIDNQYIIPEYTTTKDDDDDDEQPRSNYVDRQIMVVYKTTKSNIVFVYENIFYVINCHNVIIIFDKEMFRNVKFFCTFNFYFANYSQMYNLNSRDIIEIKRI